MNSSEDASSVKADPEVPPKEVDIPLKVGDSSQEVIEIGSQESEWC